MRTSPRTLRFGTWVEWAGGVSKARYAAVSHLLSRWARRTVGITSARAAVPQFNPPEPRGRSMSPRSIEPAWTNSSRAIGTDPADVLPYRSRFSEDGVAVGEAEDIAGGMNNSDVGLVGMNQRTSSTRHSAFFMTSTVESVRIRTAHLNTARPSIGQVVGPLPPGPRPWGDPASPQAGRLGKSPPEPSEPSWYETNPVPETPAQQDGPGSIAEEREALLVPGIDHPTIAIATDDQGPLAGPGRHELGSGHEPRR